LSAGGTAPAAWIGPLATIVVIQMTATILARMAPTLAPPLLQSLDWPESMVGVLGALNTLGAVLFLLLGAPLLRRLGSIRSLQFGLAVGVLGALGLVVPADLGPVLGVLLLGLAYGPSISAGSDVLHRVSPPRRRNLIFSIKQAGVPVGGVLAGFLLPVMAGWIGWRSTMVLTGGVALLTIAAVQPMRGRLDVSRDAGQSLRPGAFLSVENLLRPLSVLRLTPALRRMGLAGAFLAVGQGAWFSFLVTYCVVSLGQSLTTAGAIFAANQAVSIGGRLLLGWLSDQVVSGIAVLRIAAVTSAATTALLALSGPGWPVWSLFLLTGLSGITVTSWNGVQNAEIARLAPPGLVAETVSGAIMMVFLGYILGPLAFAAIVGATGRYDIAFGLTAAVTLLAWPALRRA
jgi:MFS family permease